MGRCATICGGSFALAVALDLATKVGAVAWLSAPGELVYNDRPHDLALRVAVCTVTLGVVFLLQRLALRRGVGRLSVAWFCVGVLVGGTLGNGVSTYLWAPGVPDFIRRSDGWMYNVADFEIILGLLGTAASIMVSATVAYARFALASAARTD